MCRSIKVLRVASQRATDDEISAASLQFVRKISGFHKPSKANQEAFDGAVREVAEASRRLLIHLEQDPALARVNSRSFVARSDTRRSPSMSAATESESR
jgi:hypothetical protein